MHNRLVKIVVVVISIFWAALSIAAEFIATVENNKVTFGNSVQLKLELVDAKATSNLDISALAKEFTIYQQQQYSSYSNVNGSVRAEVGWHVTLMPKRTGSITIPEISIHTNQGLLTTTPLTVEIENAKPGSIGDKTNVGITLVSSINKTKAYVNEPIIYTLKIISYKPIANVVLDDVKSNDAIVEKLGEPKQYDQLYGGMRAHIIEIRYSITALKSGKITIPPVLMQGELQVASQSASRQRFGMFNSIMFDNMFELKPFSMQSEAISISVLEPIGKSSEWLPLNNLSLSQTWDIPKDIKAGDTITRKVKMVAKGGFAKQLPSTKDAQQLDNVKVYANKPNFTDKYEEDSGIVGIKEEEFSIVPQSDGSITFPEITIKWWNLKTNKHEVSTLPAKTIDVQVATQAQANNVTLDFSQNEPKPIDAPDKVSNTDKPILLYIIIGVLCGALLTVGLILAYVITRKSNYKLPMPKFKKKTTKQELQQDEINDVDALRAYMLQYANKHWQIPINTHLNRLGDTLTNAGFAYDLQAYNDLMQGINAALYNDVQLDIASLIGLWREFQQSVSKNKNVKSKLSQIEADYNTLNPT